MSCETSYTIDDDHIIWYITYHRCMVMSYDTSPTIVTWSCHVIHHLPPMHGYVIWYITFHQYLAISYDTLTNCPWKNDHMMWFITYHRCIIKSYDISPTVLSWDTSPTIDALLCITYYWCMVISYDTSCTFDAWSCHVIHHLPLMFGHVIWFITYYRCMAVSYDESPTVMSYDT